MKKPKLNISRKKSVFLQPLTKRLITITRTTGYSMLYWHLAENMLVNTLNLVPTEFLLKKSCIRETSNLSTDADRRTDTILERLSDLSKKKILHNFFLTTPQPPPPPPSRRRAAKGLLGKKK